MFQRVESLPNKQSDISSDNILFKTSARYLCQTESMETYYISANTCTRTKNTYPWSIPGVTSACYLLALACMIFLQYVLCWNKENSYQYKQNVCGRRHGNRLIFESMKYLIHWCEAASLLDTTGCPKKSGIKKISITFELTILYNDYVSLDTCKYMKETC